MENRCLIFGTIFLCFLTMGSGYAAVSTSDKGSLIEEIKKKEAMANANSLLRSLVRGLREFYRAFGDPKNKATFSGNIDLNGDIYDQDCSMYGATMQADCENYWAKKKDFWNKAAASKRRGFKPPAGYTGDPYSSYCNTKVCRDYWDWKKKEAEKKRENVKRLIAEMQFGAIPQDEFTEWVKPILLKKLKKAMIKAKLLKDPQDKTNNSEGEEGLYEYTEKDGKGGETNKVVGIKKFREFVLETFFAMDKEGNAVFPTFNDIEKIQELRIAALKTALADAYSLTMTAQYQLSAFNERVLVPFKEDLEISEDLEQRIKKNTLIILALFAQVNLDNVLSNSAMGVQSMEKINMYPIAPKVRSFEGGEE